MQPAVVVNPYAKQKKPKPIARESESTATQPTPIIRESDSAAPQPAPIAGVSESAAKKPKREASALVLLLRNFTKKVLPRINQLGQLYSVPSGTSGRSAALKAVVHSNAVAFIEQNFPHYPYWHVPNPALRASQTKVQGIWTSVTKHKAMREITVPGGLRILVICPEIFYCDFLESDTKFAVMRNGVGVGVKPPCPICLTNAHVSHKEFSGTKGDQGVRMIVEATGDRHPVIAATWLCANKECPAGPSPKRPKVDWPSSFDMRPARDPSSLNRRQGISA